MAIEYLRSRVAVVLMLKAAFVEGGIAFSLILFWLPLDTEHSGGFDKDSWNKVMVRIPVEEVNHWRAAFHGSIGRPGEADAQLHQAGKIAGGTFTAQDRLGFRTGGSYTPNSYGSYGMKNWLAIHGFFTNRDDGCANAAFFDSSVRKVGLKQSWTLKWYRTFDTVNRWTRAGGVQPLDWPERMRSLRGY